MTEHAPLTAAELDAMANKVDLYRITATARESGMLSSAVQDIQLLLATVEALQAERDALHRLLVEVTEKPPVKPGSGNASLTRCVYCDAGGFGTEAIHHQHWCLVTRARALLGE